MGRSLSVETSPPSESIDGGQAVSCSIERVHKGIDPGAEQHQHRMESARGVINEGGIGQ
jgi:hypothetical protein